MPWTGCGFDPCSAEYAGGEPVDLEALAELIVRFSELAADAGGQIRAIDVNPVIVGPEGAVAVDALFKPA